MQVNMANVPFSKLEETYYKPEFEKIAEEHHGELVVSVATMKSFFQRLKLSHHDMQKVLNFAFGNNENIGLNAFMGTMRLCSLIKQGKKYTDKDMAKEQKILARRASKASAPQETIENPISSQTFSVITVDQPMLVPSGWFGSTSYYTYTINCQYLDSNYSVVRRFSDLDWLYSSFLVSFKGFIIPLLPDKKFLNNTDKAFIEQRRSDMEKFLNSLSSHNVFSKTQALIAFLTYPDKNFERFKTEFDCSECFEIKGIEDTIDKTIAVIQTKFKSMTCSLNASSSIKIQGISENNARNCQNFQELVMAIQVWTSVQISENSGFFELFRGFDLGSSKMFELENENSRVVKVFEEKVNAEYLRTQGLIQAIKLYEQDLSNLATKQHLMDRKLKKHRKCTDPAHAARYISEIQTLQSQIDKLLTETAATEKTLSLEHLELEKNRSERLVQGMISLVTSQKKHFFTVSQYWTSCLSINN